MRVALEPFVAEHGVEILGAAAESMLDWLIRAEVGGPAFTGRIEDGRILGAAGLILELPQVAHGWLLPTPLIKTYPVAFHRAVVTRFQGIVAALPKLRCIHGYADVAFPDRDLWMIRLGFQRVGRMTVLWPEKKDIMLYTQLVGNGHGT